jgi:hypothetical protein
MATGRFRVQDIKIPQPLIIKLEDKISKPSMPVWVEIVGASFILLLITSLLIWLVFSSYKYKSTFTTNLAPFSAKVTLDIPARASVRDPLPVTVTLVNTSASTLNLRLTLATTSLSDMILANDGTSMVKIENLPPNGTFTHTFNIILLDAPLNNTLNFAVLLTETSTDKSFQLTTSDWQMDVWSWPPHMRAIINYILAGSGFLSSLIAIFNERLKKLLDLS